MHCTPFHSIPFGFISFNLYTIRAGVDEMNNTDAMCSDCMDIQMTMSWIKCVDLTSTHLKEWEKIIIVIMAISLWIWRHATFGIKGVLRYGINHCPHRAQKYSFFSHRLWLTANATPSYLCVLFISICPHGYAIEWNVIEYIEVIGPSKVCINFKFQCIEKSESYQRQWDNIVCIAYDRQKCHSFGIE